MHSISLFNNGEKVKCKYSFMGPYIEDSTPQIIKHSKRHMVISSHRDKNIGIILVFEVVTQFKNKKDKQFSYAIWFISDILEK